MNDFSIWFPTGLQHILDINGYDHILFVSLLVIAYPVSEWRRLLILITGFTIGHSLALLLSVLDIIHLPQSLVEILIALTIGITAGINMANWNKNTKKPNIPLYFTIPLFGGIHGLGFSYLLLSMLGSAKDTALPLLYFNLGLEAGQLLIAIVLVLFCLLLTQRFKVKFSHCKFVLSCIILLLSIYLLLQRL